MIMPHEENTGQFVLCVKNDAYPVSLEVRKVYRVISDPEAASRGFVRVIDESGEDYLYPQELFLPLELPKAAMDAFV